MENDIYDAIRPLSHESHDIWICERPVLFPVIYGQGVRATPLQELGKLLGRCAQPPQN
jgi:hypothetical protein